MSHIHLPDGFLPVWLWLSGYVLAAVLVAALWRRGKTTAEPRRFALLGIFGAIMILVMMIEIPPFAFHFNLSVVTGLILGPRLAVLAALVVNLVLALIGHGGVTVVGLNTLVLSTEMIVGYYLFRLLSQTRLSLGRATFIATVVGLAGGTILAFGIVSAGVPWIDRVLQSAPSGHGLMMENGITGARLVLSRLALIMFGVGSIGWVVEGLLTAAIVVYLNRVSPDLVQAMHRGTNGPVLH